MRSILALSNVSKTYASGLQALKRVDLDIRKGEIFALLGASGCGKSTVLRCFNRMNDLIDHVRIEGGVKIGGQNIHGHDVDVIELRKRVGMVFQKPTPFPMSIFDNVAFAPRCAGVTSRGDLEPLVEECLRQAALWDEVKDRLDSLGTKLSGGQQQRLTIARALSQEPEVLMLDEFSIAVDPVTTMRIEDVLKDLLIIE